MNHSRFGRILVRIAFAALFAWIAVVTAKRGAALARGRVPLDAGGEKRFLGWAYRDPTFLPALADVQPALRPSEAVLLVCSPTCDTGWAWIMTLYGLPRQAVVGARTEGELGSVHPTRVERSRGGLRVLPRSRPEADASR